MKLFQNMVSVQAGLVLLCLAGPCVAQSAKEPSGTKEAAGSEKTKSTEEASVSYATTS